MRKQRVAGIPQPTHAAFTSCTCRGGRRRLHMFGEAMCGGRVGGLIGAEHTMSMPHGRHNILMLAQVSKVYGPSYEFYAYENYRVLSPLRTNPQANTKTTVTDPTSFRTLKLIAIKCPDTFQTRGRERDSQHSTSRQTDVTQVSVHSVLATPSNCLRKPQPHICPLTVHTLTFARPFESAVLRSSCLPSRTNPLPIRHTDRMPDTRGGQIL